MGFVRLVSPFFFKFSNENHCGNFGECTYFADCFSYSLIHKIYFKGKREYDPEFQKSNEAKIASEIRFFEIMEQLLDPGTEYKVYMTASNINGEGNRSNSIIINTPAKGECRSVDL